MIGGLSILVLVRLCRHHDWHSRMIQPSGPDTSTNEEYEVSDAIQEVKSAHSCK